MDNEEKQDYIFTKEQITNFAGFSNTLKKIHTRLINEGYIIKDGIIIPPPKKLA